MQYNLIQKRCPGRLTKEDVNDALKRLSGWQRGKITL
jgi:hypothetical protein